MADTNKLLPSYLRGKDGYDPFVYVKPCASEIFDTYLAETAGKSAPVVIASWSVPSAGRYPVTAPVCQLLKESPISM